MRIIFIYKTLTRSLTRMFILIFNKLQASVSLVFAYMTRSLTRAPKVRVNNTLSL